MTAPATKNRIENYGDLLSFFSAENKADLHRHVFKGTDCGAWITLQPIEQPDLSQSDVDTNEETLHATLQGFTIGSIVEGSDVELDPKYFSLPVTELSVTDWMSELEQDAAFYWRRDNLETFIVYHIEDNMLTGIIGQVTITPDAPVWFMDLATGKTAEFCLNKIPSNHKAIDKLLMSIVDDQLAYKDADFNGVALNGFQLDNYFFVIEDDKGVVQFLD